jgi:hypothetical protein
MSSDASGEIYVITKEDGSGVDDVTQVGGSGGLGGSGSGSGTGTGAEVIGLRVRRWLVVRCRFEDENGEEVVCIGPGCRCDYNSHLGVYEL